MPLTHLQEHLDLIARHEQEFLARRTQAERRIDAIAGFIGSVGFVVVHLGLFTLWMAWNSLPGTHHFDPRPFALLQTVVAIESLLAASFILMRQSRLARRSEEREHLLLQVALLTEKETTALLNLERKVARQVGLEQAANAADIRELARDTPIDEVAQVIQQTLTEAESGEAGDTVTLGLSGEGPR